MESPSGCGERQHGAPFEIERSFDFMKKLHGDKPEGVASLSRRAEQRPG
jgi:hypothetical protein